MTYLVFFFSNTFTGSDGGHMQDITFSQVFLPDLCSFRL